MKSLLILLISLFVLYGCAKKEIHVYDDTQIDQFDKVLSNINNGKTKAYDLRNIEDCTNGRIPGFYCMRTLDVNGQAQSLDEIFDGLIWKIGEKYGNLIILIDDNSLDAPYLANKLLNAGYYNVHYFKSGYDRYVDLKGDSFIPEVGECNICG